MSAENRTFCDASTESVCAWKSETASLQREKRKRQTDREACRVGSVHGFLLQGLLKPGSAPASSVRDDFGPFQKCVLTSLCPPLFF